MERRSFLALLAVPAVAPLIAACGDDAGEAEPSDTTPATDEPNANEPVVLKGTAARVTTGTDPAAAAAAVNAFAADLYEQLAAADPQANLVFSPASVAIALAMTSAGAKGTTLDEMNGVLNITDPAGIHRSMNGLSAAFDSYNKSKDLTAEGGEGTAEVALNIANSLWGQQTLTFEQSFLDVLSAEYGAGMNVVDYQADPEQARADINAWVAEETDDRITDLLGEGVITADTLLTLVNAVHLKANWAQEFYEAATKPGDFTTAAGDTVTVDMMNTGGDLPYAEGAGWQAVEIDYVFNDLGFVVAVGDSVPDSAVVFPALAPRLATLAIPKFDYETAVPLGSTLQALGMPTPFGDQADFSGITTDVQLFITDVVHQANITIDEKGTEAAAATAVAMAGTAAPVDPPVPVVLDRPFTYWLRDKHTNAILFMGRVNDPTA